MEGAEGSALSFQQLEEDLGTSDPRWRRCAGTLAAKAPIPLGEQTSDAVRGRAHR